jgi:isoleucyl-tRNA synthetase
VGLCINPNETYVKVRQGGEVYYLAKALAKEVLKEEFEILEEYTGKDLEYKEYEPLFAFQKTDQKAFFVTVDDYVTLTDGTGVVHIAPAFGEDDSRVGRKYNLPFVQMVDSKGEMTKETPWEGVFCKKADKMILKDLEESGLLFEAPDLSIVIRFAGDVILP